MADERIDNGTQVDEPSKEELAARALPKRIKVVKKLKGYVEKIELDLAIASTSKGKVLNSLIERNKKTVAALIRHPNLPHGAARPLRRLMSELVSTEEAIRLASKPIKARFEQPKKVVEAVAEIQAALESRQAYAASGYDDKMNLIYDQARKIIRETHKEAKKLDSIGQKPMVLARVPVVPLLDNGSLNTSVLNRQGLKSDNLGGYALIHNQLVIGLNKEALSKTGKKNEKVQDAALRYCKSLSVAMGRTVNLVSAQGVPHKGGVWYWVGDDRTINSIRKASVGSFRIRSWGFGFGASTEGEDDAS